MQFRDYQGVHQMLLETVNEHANKEAYRWFDDNAVPDSVTWSEFYRQVKQVAKSLMALGVKKDDKVNILSYTSYRWVLTDMANMSIGGVTVGIYQSNLPKDCQYIIDHSDAVVVFAEDEKQVAKLLEIKAEIPEIRQVIMLKGDMPGHDWIISYETFLGLGKNISDEDFNDRTARVDSGDLAGIVYTSGTTGLPKGVMLTHDNITSTAQSVFHSGNFRGARDNFLFLPLAHVFARTCSYGAVLVGNRTTFARSINTLLDDFQLASPHWFVSVPRIFEKIHTRVVSDVEAKGGITEKIFNWSLAVGEAVGKYKLAQQPIPSMLQFKYRIATKLVFSKIHNALGGEIQWCISGGAPLSPDIARFFHATGLLILEGLGMTENTSFSNLNRFDKYDFGVVGPPGEGLFHKIADDGEVLFKGRNVMKGYYKMPDETRANFTEDGWLRSGDIGKILEGNVLKITGRKKEIIITSGGKNVAPSAIEGLMSTSKYINQVCVVGDQRKFLSAIVTLDEENVTAYAREKGFFNECATTKDLLAHDAVIQLIDGEVARKNKELPSFETLKKVTIVPEFTIENKMMTPTFKVKKNVIMDNYQDHIENMYH
ncbi:long-chain acyl-CoA synthetase [Desulfocicer vacuolatum DSM 3385]|uniref:Long-chain acyl-CoA synthetase n=1 Tax=Desulfocicer vacuolatum DSM 3385 TaxID=1121400 RepID=A0A1W2BRK5_9BACT|nr:long-chain fatty acid--CoA ligase [Desulfocicer vacuolatum]SMC75501.1 long-chain acyl-CoA synthetase [Desulfocicer vacuolatum DSM 3385]